jgi:hypothetical protein
MTDRLLHTKRPVWLAALVLALFGAVTAEAYTRWDGRYFLENAYASRPDSDSNLFQTGVNLSIRPPTKKSLKTRLNIRLDYTNADGDALWNLSPIGNLGVDLAGDSFALNLQHTRTATITTDAELVENKTSRVALSLSPRHWPRLSTSYSRLENTIDGVDTSTSDLYSLYTDYDFRRWLSVRAGYNYQQRSAGSSNDVVSDSTLFGVGVNRQLMARTQLTGDVNFTRATSDSDGGFSTSSDSYGLRLGIDSRPSPWLGIGAHYSTDSAESSSSSTPAAVTTRSRYADLTGSVYPLYGVRFWSTVGNRNFSGGTQNRSVDYYTLGGSVSRDVSDTVAMNLTGSRTFESDPGQGDNTRDSLGLNTLLDLTSRASLRFNLNVSRNEFPTFVSTEGFDASEPLINRDNFDNEPAGFTFFDTDNNDLYTKNSILFADWSEPVRIDPPSDEKFFVSKSLQASLRPTDKLNLTLYYTLSSSADTLDLLESERKALNASLSYQPNRRTSYSLTGNHSSAAAGSGTYNGSLNVNYRLLRGHQINSSYGRRFGDDESSDTFTTNLRLVFRKRNNLELTYAGTQMFQDDQTEFFRVRYSHSF